MSQSITIDFEDGTKRVWTHEGRAGGSYTKRIRYEGQVAIVSDEWGTETAFPLSTIKAIEVRQ